MKKVVILGGGTGLSALLRGLKLFPIDITAVVTVADDGSSTGRLRKEFNIPAVGDLRKVLVSLAEVEPLVEELLQYRFDTYSDLDKHTVGNLMLTALYNITGSLTKSLESLSKILNIKGKVLPFTEDKPVLVAHMTDGTIVEGEEEITLAHKKIDKIKYKNKIKVTDEVLNAIAEADLIIIGIGSLYTSIIPNLLTKEVKKALINAKAKKMYICNIMTQPGETDDHNVLDHVNAIVKHTNKNIIDYVISNNEVLPKEMIDRYQKDGAKQVILDDKQRKILKTMGAKTIEENLIEIKNNYIRHDAGHISDIVINLALRHDNDKDK